MRTTSIALIALAMLAGPPALAQPLTATPPHVLAGTVQEQGEAHLGQRVHLAGLTITPLRIVEDSRCPMNARCIRAGTVRVALRIRDSHGSRRIVLAQQAPMRVRGATIALVAVTPDHVAGEPAPADPTLHLSVSR